ncbi:uncharacterized protein [Phyllobates terribilis]|uniref:uncharacterized protein isoform X3 n=1 Tax=Phyllobates terribilis TaxID=111132 RepID=UPI003CCAEEBA
MRRLSVFSSRPQTQETQAGENIHLSDTMDGLSAITEAAGHLAPPITMIWRPPSHRAGHFEHVAHMNMFHSESPIFRIPAKISFVKLSVEEADPAGFREKKINASDPGREMDICSKLIEQVKQDVHLSDEKDKNGPENSPTSRSSAKEKRNGKGRREENVNRPQNDDHEDVEWAKAKEKIEEFLDFPGFMAAMECRNQSKAHGSSQSSSKNGGGRVTRGEPDSIPNTRHNANFSRDHEKAAKVVPVNCRCQKNKRPQTVDSPGSTTKPRNQGAKMVEKPSSLVAPESDTGTER